MAPILVTLEVVPGEADWAPREKFWISYFRERSGALLNATDGGDGGRLGLPHTEETRRKISALKKGRPGNKGWSFTPEQRERISQSLKGRTLSPEHRAAIAATLKRDRPLNVVSLVCSGCAASFERPAHTLQPSQSGKRFCSASCSNSYWNHNGKKTLSEESREKMRILAQARLQSEEGRRQLREALEARWARWRAERQENEEQ